MSDELSIVPKSQSPDIELLTLREVCERTGWEYERLRPYLKGTGFDEFVGARPMKGSKGVGYPLDALPWFVKLKEDADPLHRKVTPKTLPEWLKATAIVQSGQSSDSQAIGSLALLPERQAQVVIQAIAYAMQKALPPVEDELMPLRAAVERYGIPIGVLRRLSKKVAGKRLVRKSDVLRWIADL